MSTPAKSPSPEGLEERIRRQITEHGPLPFSRFMELALYDAEEGYYASGRAAIGKEGDFYTNVSTGPIFGKILSRQFEEIWTGLGRPPNFSIVEQGAFDGRFAADVMKDAKRRNPEFFSALSYRIVEPFPCMRERQKCTLQSHSEKITWADYPGQLPEIEGVYFANELVDALPVELVEWDGSQWRERRVSLQDGKLAFVPHGIENTVLARRLEHLPVPQREYRTEINIASDDWLKNVTQKLRRGMLLLCDYGYPRSVYYSAERREGTLSCYSKHRRSFDPLREPGAKDISVHVDFTSLAESALSCGFEVAGFADQHHFMVGAAEKFLREIEQKGIDPQTQRDLRAFQSLLHPETMGRAFHYIAFRSGTDLTISGFRHSANGIRDLEIAGSLAG